MIGDLMGLMERIEKLRAAGSWSAATPAQRKEFGAIKWAWDKFNHDRMDPDLVKAVDNALGWGLLGLDRLLEALAALVGSLRGSDDLDAAGYAFEALKVREKTNAPRFRFGPLDFDPDAPGGGPFGRVAFGKPPAGFEGPPRTEAEALRD